MRVDQHYDEVITSDLRLSKLKINITAIQEIECLELEYWLAYERNNLYC